MTAIGDQPASPTADAGMDDMDGIKAANPRSLVVDRDGDVWAEQPTAGTFQCLTSASPDKTWAGLDAEFGPLQRYYTGATYGAALIAAIEAAFADVTPADGGAG